MRPEADRADVVARLAGSTGRGSSQAAHVGEAGRARAARRSPRAPAKFHGPRPAVRSARRTARAADLARDRVEARDVARAAALRHQPAAGPQRGVQALEEALVVGHPVEDGVGEDGVDRLVELELGEVGLRTRRPRSPSASRARSTIDGEASTATTWPPRQPLAAASAVTRPVPQPASSTVSSPRSSQAVEHLGRPTRAAGPRRGRRWRRPSRGRVTAPWSPAPAARARPRSASIASASASVTPDVVEPVRAAGA